MMFEKPTTIPDINTAYFMRQEVNFALEQERIFYRRYFKDRINIIQRLVSALPEKDGQELLKKIIK